MSAVRPSKVDRLQRRTKGQKYVFVIQHAELVYLQHFEFWDVGRVWWGDGEVNISWITFDGILLQLYDRFAETNNSYLRHLHSVSGRFIQWRRLHGAREHVPPLLQIAGHGGHRE